jgi:peroxiredoxin
VLFLADGNGEFTKAMDLELDGSGFGLGSRSQRYAAVIEDGVVSTARWMARLDELAKSILQCMLSAGD